MERQGRAGLGSSERFSMELRGWSGRVACVGGSAERSWIMMVGSCNGTMERDPILLKWAGLILAELYCIWYL